MENICITKSIVYPCYFHTNFITWKFQLVWKLDFHAIFNCNPYNFHSKDFEKNQVLIWNKKLITHHSTLNNLKKCVSLHPFPFLPAMLCLHFCPNQMWTNIYRKAAHPDIACSFGRSDGSRHCERIYSKTSSALFLKKTEILDYRSVVQMGCPELLKIAFILC